MYLPIYMYLFVNIHMDFQVVLIQLIVSCYSHFHVDVHIVPICPVDAPSILLLCFTWPHQFVRIIYSLALSISMLEFFI